MALTAFTIVKYEDKYKLTNTGAFSITASVTIQNDDCTGYDLINTNEIAPDETKTLTLPYDGQYQINLIDTDSEESSILILHYLSLLNSIVDDIQFILCDCAEDSECIDCSHTEECNRQLATILKINSYISLTHPRHAAFLQVVFKAIQCSVKEMTNQLVAEEKISGNGDHVPLLKKILSYYYLAFYHSEFKSVTTTEQGYINTKFQYEQVSTCIEDTIVTEVQTNIDNMSTITINSGAYVNLPPSVGDYEVDRPNRVTTVLTLDWFTSLPTPQYSDPENDPIDAVRVEAIPGTNQGVFEYDNAPITVGLIIPAEHINAERLVHIGADTDGVVSDSFDFVVRDTGSGQWST